MVDFNEEPDMFIEEAVEATQDQIIDNAGAELDMLGQTAGPQLSIEAAPEQLPDVIATPQDQTTNQSITPEELAIIAQQTRMANVDTFDQQLDKPAGMADPRVNTLPKKMPPGLTEIHPEDGFPVTQALAQSFPSMNELGMLLDPNDRVAYSVSVMGNESLDSQIKAQIIEEAMRRGKIAPEALASDWYLARGINLRPMIDLGGGNVV